MTKGNVVSMQVLDFVRRKRMVNKSKKRLTLWQIAELSGTSKSTVSRVLTNAPHVSQKTRECVRKVIEEQGFRPNFFARGLRGGPTGQIAVLGRWMERGFIADVIQGIDDVAGRHDAHLLTCFAHSADDYIGLWRQFAEARQVDGMILIAPPRELLSEKVNPDEMPLVLCACSAPNSRKGWQNVDSVTLDNAGAMQQLLEHLVEQGCRHLVHLRGSAAIFETEERARIFAEFVDLHKDVRGEIIRVRETCDAGREAAVAYIEEHGQPPHAFVCFNDAIALGALGILRERGFSIPADVAITGFDDAGLAEAWGLTTIAVPGIQIGQECARLVITRLTDRDEAAMARNAVVKLTLRVRDSSRRATVATPPQASAS